MEKCVVECLRSWLLVGRGGSVGRSGSVGRVGTGFTADFWMIGASSLHMWSRDFLIIILEYDIHTFKLQFYDNRG